MTIPDVEIAISPSSDLLNISLHLLYFERSSLVRYLRNTFVSTNLFSIDSTPRGNFLGNSFFNLFSDFLEIDRLFSFRHLHGATDIKEISLQRLNDCPVALDRDDHFLQGV